MGDNNTSIDLGFMAVALLCIAFYGEPDLVDALIHYLMSGCGC